MLRVVTAADADPISLEEAKAHLRRDDGDDDTIIKLLIPAVTRAAQSRVQRLFVTQTVEFVLTNWCGGCIELPIAPVVPTGVKSIKYANYFDNTTQTLDPALYVAQTSGHSVRIIQAYGVIWPLVSPFSPEPIVIRFDVGQAPADINANIKAAILLILGHLYENRANVVVDASRVQAIELPQGAESLLLDEIW